MYNNIPLKKKDGTPREIRAPQEELKQIQRSILDVILVKKSLPSCAYGFAPGKGIIENAQRHVQSRYMLNIDIKDFFPSVHHTRVNRLFQKLGATPNLARILTILTTHDHSLPQGAPSSPYIAALALEDLDRRITLLCKENRLTYTRYFDDIAISGDVRAHEILATVVSVISASGYSAHTRADKLRLYGPNEKRLITGIEIENGKLQVPNISDVIVYIKDLQLNGLKALRDDDPFREQLSLKGKIAFITQVDPDAGNVIKKEYDAIVWS